MNSKRQRRPNVRLGEIGDVSAAFSCGFPLNNKEKSSYKSWRHEQNPVNGFSKKISNVLTVLEPDVSPQALADLQQNRENKNPNSLKSAYEFPDPGEIDMIKSKLDFANVTRKCRIMKRRGRSINGSYSFLGSAWTSKLSPEFDELDVKEFDGTEFVRSTSNEYEDNCAPVNDFKNLYDSETPAISKETSENEIHQTSTQEEGNYDGYWKYYNRFDGNTSAPKLGNMEGEIKFESDDVITVRGWLEELGLGKYAGAFEMHEVDEEVLPLLTVDDLKEIGICAVGPRRKLYNAIQRLRGGGMYA